MRGTSVYVHFPWCLRKCPYCDFATRKIEPAELPHQAYAAAVVRELQLRQPSIRDSHLVSIFFGGGTPSLWEPTALSKVIEAIRSAFETEQPHLEVTIECNPASVRDGMFAGLADAGATRFSIGVQSLSDDHLEFLGRLHRSADARNAVSEATQVVNRVSADLMFGMADHEIDRLLRDIDTLVELGLTHVSSYALTIEPGTRFGELHRRGRLTVASEDTYADMFVRAQEAFEKRGFDHYEVSNYAAPGQESVHNAHYWKGGDYLGLGAAAVGCLLEAPGRARRYKNILDGLKYIKAMDTADSATRAEFESEVLDGPEIVQEHLMLGLRTSAGLDLGWTRQRASRAVNLGRERAIERLVAAGDLVETENQLQVPRDRWLGLDRIVRALF